MPSGEDAWKGDRRDRRGNLTRDTKLRSWSNSNTAPSRNQDRLKSVEPPQDKGLVNHNVEDDTTVVVDSYADQDSILPAEEPVPDRVAGFGRDRVSFKTRGSITSQIRSGDAVVIRANQRTNDLRAKMNAGKEKKRKAKALKKVNADVFIPSTVSVGQLARLLNVRMGACKYLLLWHH